MPDFTVVDKFSRDKSFTNVKFGWDVEVTELELNELQKMQNELRADLMRASVHSGVLNISGWVNGSTTPLVKGGYATNLSPTAATQYNSIRLSDNAYLINGYRLIQPLMDGSTNPLIPLPAPPTFGTRDDLVFLEMWFQEVKVGDTIPQYGGDGTTTITNDLQDTRMGKETSRRIQLKWRIRTVAGVDFNKYPEGVGGVNSVDRNYAVQAQGGLASPLTETTNAITPIWAFYSASDRSGSGSTGKKVFTDDQGLYIAGDGTPSSKTTLNTEDGYVYAIPLFRVKRRNSAGYRKDNLSGARDYKALTQIYTLSPALTDGGTQQVTFSAADYANLQVGDRYYHTTQTGYAFRVLSLDGSNKATIQASITTTSMANINTSYGLTSDRPDGLFSNIIDAQDIIDLRHQVSLTGFSYPKLLAENFDRLMRGELVSSLPKQTVKEQYGLRKAPLGLKQELAPTTIKRADGTSVDLVNIMGIDGNCEDVTRYSPVGATLSIDSANKSIGSNSIKVTTTTTGMGFFARIGATPSSPVLPLDPTKYYLIVADVKNGTASAGARIRYYNGTTASAKQPVAFVTDSSKFTTQYIKLQPSDLSANDNRFYYDVNGNAIGQTAYIDGFRLYQIDQATYNLIDVDPNWTGGDKIAALYPYVDSYPNFVENLLPPFTDPRWTIHANAAVVEPYKLTMNHTASNQYSSVVVDCLPSQAYSLSAGSASTLGYDVYWLDSASVKTFLMYVIGTKTFTTPAGAVKLQIQTGGASSGTNTFAQPQLEKGDTANPFVPYGRYYLPQDYLGNTHLGDKAITHFEGIGGEFDSIRTNFSDAQVSEVKNDIVEALRTPQSHIKVTQATDGIWAVNDKIELNSYYGFISGVIDTDTALLTITEQTTVTDSANITVKVTDTSAVAVGDDLVLGTTTALPYYFNVKAVDATNKTVILETLAVATGNPYGINNSVMGNDSVNTRYLFESTTSTSVPLVTATGIAGTWAGLGTKKATYTITTAPTTNTTNIGLQYSVNYPAGKGITYLPASASDLLLAEVNGQRHVTGTTVSVRGNFEGKVTANTDLNPHKSYGRGGLTVLGSPTNGTDFGASSELAQDSYGRTTALDGSLYSISTGTGLNGIAQHLFSFDLIRLVEDKYGEIPADGLANKVQWLKDNIGTIRANWWGYGSSPAGNKATVTAWNNASPSWFSPGLNHTNGTVTKVGYTLSSANAQATPTNCIDTNGFSHFLAYADPAGNIADPTVAPTLSTAANAGSTLPAATYYAVYTWVNASGETLKSPETSIAVAAGQNLVATIPALPPGITSANVYISTATGTETKQGSTATTTFTQSTALAAGTALPAVSNCLVASTIITDYVEVEVELKVAETGYTVFQPENPLPKLSENMLTANQAFPVDIGDFAVRNAATVTVDSLGKLNVTSTSPNTNGDGCNCASISVKPNTYYTISYEVASVLSIPFDCKIWGFTSSVQLSIRTHPVGDKGRYSQTFNTGTNTSIRLEVYTAHATLTGSIVFGNLKLQEGAVATPWSEGRSKKKTLNFLGKVAGSVTENPHRGGRRTATLMTTPVIDGASVAEIGGSNYTNIGKQDGVVYSDTTSMTAGYYCQNLFEFDLSHLGMSLSQLKAALRKLTVSWTGYGDGTQGELANPTAAPTLAVSAGSGMLTAGTYYVQYTWKNANGQTMASPEASIAVASGQKITITLPALPAGATTTGVYVNTASGTEQWQADTTATTYNVDDPLMGGATVPASNTTGVKTYGATMKLWSSSTNGWTDWATNTASVPTTTTPGVTTNLQNYVTKDQKVYVLVHSTYPAGTASASEVFTDYVKLDVELADYVDYVKHNVVKVRPESKEMKLFFPARPRKIIGGGANHDNVALHYKHIPVFPTIATAGENATFLAEADGFLVSDLGNVVASKQGAHHYPNPLYRAGMDRTDVFGDFGFGTIPFAADSKGVNIGAKVTIASYGFQSAFTQQYGVTSLLKKPMVGIARYLVMHNNELKLFVYTAYTNNGLLSTWSGQRGALIPINGRPLVREQEGIQRAGSFTPTAWRTPEGEMQGYLAPDGKVITTYV